MGELPVGQRVAIVGALLVALGALGPWAAGARVQESVMGSDEATPYVRWGVEGAGWLLALPAGAAVVLLVAPVAPGVRAWGAGALLGLCLLLALLAARDPVDFPGFGIHVFERYEVRPGWGLGVAAFGSVLGLAAVLSDVLAARRRTGRA